MKRTFTGSSPHEKVMLQLLRWAVLPILLAVLNQTVFAQGYIYVHKSTLNEEASPNFTINVTGPSAFNQNYTVNDQPALLSVEDLGGASNGRLFAIARSSTTGPVSSNGLYYRDVNSSTWTSVSTPASPVAVDGGLDGSGIFSTNVTSGATNRVYAYTSTGTINDITGNLPDGQVVDVSDNWGPFATTRRQYAVLASGAIYQRVGTSPTWILIGSATAHKVDAIPNTDAIVYVDGAFPTVTGTIFYRNVLAGSSTNLVQTGRDIGATSDGTYYTNNTSNNVSYSTFTGGAGIWTQEGKANNGFIFTGGPAGQLWQGVLIGNNNSKRIVSRTPTGEYIDDERVRTAQNDNSVLLSLPAGSYTLTESSVSGWTVQNITTYPAASATSTDIVNRTATVTVTTGGIAHVVFENGLTQTSAITNDCSTAFTETFGTGTTYGGPLTGLTSYHLASAPYGFGYYALISNTNLMGTYPTPAVAQDHTVGDVNGRMLAVDATAQAGVFYRRRITGVIPGLNYTLSAWIQTVSAGAPDPVNVSFQIKNTTTGAVIASNTTGNINVGGWVEKTLSFSTASETSIDFELVNNTFGTNGNDLLIDDISFGITQTVPPVVAVTQAGCTTPGSITVTSPLGVSLEYSIDGVTYQSSTVFASVPPGSYSVTARYTGTTNCASAPTSVTLNPAICGTVFSDSDGGTIDGTPTNTVAGNTFYVSTVNPTTGNVISTTAVQPDGTYSLTASPSTSYSVVLSTAPQTVGSPVSATVLTGAANTAEGTSPTGDGTPDGKTPVTTATTSVTGVNFGIDPLPVAGSGTNQVPNPGGTTPVTVSNTAFNNTTPTTDTAPGSVTAIRITAFPSNVTSLTINGVTYTAASPQFTGGTPTGVTVPTDGSGNPTVAIAVDPTNDANPISIPYKAIDNAGKESANTGSAQLTFPTLFSLSGNVLSDGNGLTDGTVNHIGSGPSPVDGTDVDPVTAGSQPVYATLVNSGGTAVATVPVTAAGSYTFVSVPAGTYSVVLSTNPAGSLTPSLPTSLTNVGENLGTGAGSDGPANGILTGITVAANVTDANFGIDKAPVVVANTDTPRANPGGNLTTPVSSTVFSGTDLEDGTYANLNGRTVTLTPATNGTLFYNGSPVNSTTAITGFNPALVSLDPTALGATTGSGGASPDPTFTYSVTDNAGVVSSPATVTVPFTAPLLLSGTVFSDPNGLTNSLIDGTPTNTVAGNTFYVSTTDPTTGNVISTTAVQPDGTYSLPVSANTSYSVVLSNAPQTVGSPVSATLLTGAVNTGEGTAPAGDGTPNGQTPVSVVTTSVTGVNFGVEVPPTATSSTLASQPNPGGTLPIVVPPASFTGTDPDGTLTSVIFTGFPTGVTSVTIAGNPYTAGTFPPTGVTATVGSPVSVDPTDPATSVVIPFQVVDNAGKPSSNTATVTIPLTTLPTLSGNVLSDGNGLTDGTVNHIGSGPSPVDGTDVDPITAGSQPVYATLVNSGGTAVATVPVTAVGSYTFVSVPAGTYSVVLSTNPAGSLTPSLPTSLTNVGENLGTAAGSDGPANGILTGITVASTDVVNANFGIDQRPVGAPITVASQPNPGGNVAAPVPATAFTGTDLEDGTYPANLNGRTVTLTPGVNGTLYYNSTPVTSATTITGFNPALVTLDPTALGATTGADPTFTYAVLDNAGVPSAPATVTVPFTAGLPTLSGNVLDDGNGLNDNTVNRSGTGALTPVNGTSLDGSPLYATLVTSGGTAVATVPVTSGGTYSFPGVVAGTYSVVLSTNPAGSLTPSLPTSWTNTGENLGTGTGNDGLPNGILTSIVVGASDVTEANFGIDKKPMVNPITVAAQPNPGGAIAAPVPATAFTGSDSEDGTYPTNLTGREVTLSPATNGTLFYDGTPVTSTTAITGFNPALVTLDPTAPGATTGNDPTFTYTVKDNAGVISPPATVTVPFTSALVSLSGSVLNDGNGLTDGTVNTFGASALSPLNGTDIDPAVGGSQPVYATLVDNTSTAVATVPVTAAGTYSFPGVAPGTYSVVLSTNPAGSLIPSLPTSWTNVGEHLGTGAGSDGPANGILTGIVVAASPVTDANFGIDQAPVVSSITLAAQPNPGGTAQAPVSSTAFTGSDLEEGTYPTNLTGRTVTLSPATNGTLFYNGSPVTSTTAITGFNPTLVSLDPTATGATTGSGGASPDPTFTYAVSDNAGVVSAPATVTVPFTAPVPDVAPIIHALPSTQYGLTNTTVVVDVYELNSVATSGLITVYVSKDPLVSLSFNPAATFVGGRPVQNSIWTLTSTADSYIFTTTQVISGGGKRSLGLTGVINPNNTQGTLTLSSTVVGGSGGEVRIDNNSDAEKIDYFKK